jgi:hypothetical protein
MFPECRHIKTSGGKCGSPALRGQPFCYFHSRLRERTARQPRAFEALELPPLEDRGAIQLAISEIVTAVAHYKMDHKRAVFSSTPSKSPRTTQRIARRLSLATPSPKSPAPSTAKKWLPKAQQPRRPKKKPCKVFWLRKLEDRPSNPGNLAQITRHKSRIMRNLSTGGRGMGIPRPANPNTMSPHMTSPNPSTNSAILRRDGASPVPHFRPAVIERIAVPHSSHPLV